MNAAGRWLSIIGIGEDGLDGLSPVARTLLAQASLVVGGRRHLALAAAAIRGDTMAWPSPPQAGFPAIIARRGMPVAVLASGDPFFYGIGSLLAREIPPEEYRCLPAPSAFSLAAARLGWAVQDCALVTLHGRPLAGLVRHLQPRARILVLSWDESTPEAVAGLLRRHGLGAATLTICEALGGPGERLTRMTAAGFALDGIDPLNVVAIEIGDAAGAPFRPLVPGLPDALFDHDGQLTKRDVRAITLAALAPLDGELLWDVGAGAGSVAIEWLLAGPRCRAIAIERDPSRAARILANAAALGVPQLEIVTGSAPAALDGLPCPDAVFIGGGATHPGLLDAAWAALRPGGRLVVNAVTLETQGELIRRFRAWGGELQTIQLAHADAIGGFHGLRPAMAVMQFRAARP